MQFCGDARKHVTNASKWLVKMRYFLVSNFAENNNKLQWLRWRDGTCKRSSSLWHSNKNKKIKTKELNCDECGISHETSIHNSAASAD